MFTSNVRFPRRVILMVIALTLLPGCLNLLGISFTVSDVVDPDIVAVEKGLKIPPFRQLSGAFIHTIMEWTAVCLAFMTAAAAVLHFQIKRDLATPIIGAALLFCGAMDAFHTLAADRLISAVADETRFVPFSWAISRIFHASILTIGTAIVLRFGRQHGNGAQRGLRFFALIGILFGLLAYVVIQICAVAPQLPQTVYPTLTIPRPFDALALIIYFVGGGFAIPRFYHRHPSLFAHGLMVSLIPHIAAQCYAAFGSASLYDNAFNVAQYLKILGYLVPFAGVLIDFTHAYRAEVALKASEEALRIARDVQQSLLPAKAPEIEGYQLAGFSFAAGAVGGDYYDFVPMVNGRWSVVVADVSGHDVGASILMSQTRAYLRAVSEDLDDIGQVITRVNRFLSKDVRDRRFVSLFIAEIDSNSDQVRYIGAGQTAFLVRDVDRIQELKLTCPLLGVLDEEIRTMPPITMEPNDLLIVFTDGIAEARSPQGEQFGNQRVFDSVTKNRLRPASEIVSALYQDIMAFTNGRSEDDLTVAMIQRLAGPKKNAPGTSSKERSDKKRDNKVSFLPSSMSGSHHKIPGLGGRPPKPG